MLKVVFHVEICFMEVSWDMVISPTLTTNESLIDRRNGNISKSGNDWLVGWIVDLVGWICGFGWLDL